MTPTEKMSDEQIDKCMASTFASGKLVPSEVFALLCAQAKEANTLRLSCEEERKDARRFKWALPILSGDDDHIANERALQLAGGLLSGKKIREIIDAALGSDHGSEG